ncbi:beta-1,3-galactosyltransferase brn [Scaptodrosophila lebanonensis]|uniref:Hexosyltransferase n=1 Tax=Drosophila lebanonensis TaxID=7225 RepID=A0A6J2U0Y8_DROLE|nr:beta-1,3-galactosyltransferase brn [Scaptodrosophila lebanonensis]
MLRKHYKLLLKCALVVPFVYLLDYCGIPAHFLEIEFEKNFYYPLQNQSTNYNGTAPTTLKFLNIPAFSETNDPPRLTILVKSAIGNADRRDAIRRTWGYESRFSDVHIRTAFLLGVSPNYISAETTSPIARATTEQNIAKEAKQHGDIVRAEFVDAYFNNTIKTMMGLRWASEHFSNSDFYMFVDDDYYVSIKNVLRFLGRVRRLGHQHDLLYAGYVFQSAPLRHKFSKWYVSLQEYPFDKWPPYVTAGAFILSHDALLRMYEVGRSVPLFRFDDIYIGIIALKANIPLHHCNDFHFHRPHYTGPESYSSVIAAHGFDFPDEMERVWNECRSANYA